MADLVITAANVTAGTGAIVESGTAGEAIAAGKAVYRDPTTKKIGLADSDGTVNAKNVIGIAISSAALNQPVSYVKGGLVNLGTVLTGGTSYWLSNTAGGIAPFADVGTGETAILLGVATSTSALKVAILNSGVTL